MALMLYKSYTGLITPYCTATIVGSMWVLTAGHCLADFYNPGLATSSSRSARLSRMGKTLLQWPRPSASTSIQTTNTEPLPVNDIALVQLKQELAFSDRDRPICLAAEFDEEKDIAFVLGEKGIVAGWGLLNFEYPPMTKNLHEAEVELQQFEQCQR